MFATTSVRNTGHETKESRGIEHSGSEILFRKFHLPALVTQDSNDCANRILLGSGTFFALRVVETAFSLSGVFILSHCAAPDCKSRPGGIARPTQTLWQSTGWK